MILLLLLLQLPCSTRIAICWYKSLATKEQARKEGPSIWEEEHCLDTELFPNEHAWWDVRGSHCLFILQRMLVHAAESRQKEAERLICHSHGHGLPRLDPEADVPAVQLVGYQTSREEIGYLFHQVYMLKRLPGPPLCRPKWAWEVTRDILSSLKDHQWCRRGEQSGGSRELEPARTHPSCHWNKASQRERAENLVWIGACQGQGGPLMGPGSCLHIGRADREAELVNYHNEAGHLPLFPKANTAKKRVLRAELKVP